MKRPAWEHPFFRGLRAPLHISHRGGAQLAPENTLVAFREARERWHTDVLELDVHATKDGEVVVAHDATVDRCTDGVGRIADLTFAELSKLDAAFRFVPVGASAPTLRGQGHRIPRFTEVLDAFPGVPLNVEVKAESALGPFFDLVTERQCLERLCLGSEDDALAEQLSNALPAALMFYPATALAAFILPTKGGEPPEDSGRYHVLDMPLEWEGVTVFDAGLAKVARAHGKWVNVWTVNEEAKMRAALADGVGGVMTDRPDLLRAVLGA